MQISESAQNCGTRILLSFTCRDGRPVASAHPCKPELSLAGRWVIGHNPELKTQSFPVKTCNLSPRRWHTRTLWLRTQRPKGLMVSELLRSSWQAIPFHPLPVGLPTSDIRRASCQREHAQVLTSEPNYLSLQLHF